MSYEMVAQGSILDITELSAYDDFIAEGQKTMLELDLRTPVSSSIVSELQSQLMQAGVQEAKVTTGSPLLRIEFRKGFAWLPVIGAIIMGMIVLAILIVGWRLFKDVVSAGVALPMSIGVLLLIVLGVIVLTRRRA